MENSELIIKPAQELLMISFKESEKIFMVDSKTSATLETFAEDCPMLKNTTLVSE